MKFHQIGLLILLSALWGSVFMLIKYALLDFSAAEVAFLRAAVGAPGLLILVAIQGGEARAALGDIRRRPGWALVLGAFAIAIPFLLMALGELTVPSGLAGVLISTTPMFIALFAPGLDRTEKITLRQGAGLIIGLLGVALVVGLHAVHSLNQFLGALALLGAAASGALSSFVVKLQYKGKGIPAATTSFFSLSVGAILTLPVAIFSARHEPPGVVAVLAVIVLGLVCTALAFTLYYKLIEEIGAERATLATYLTPMFAFFYGALLLSEAITIWDVIGVGLIIVGAEITLRKGSTKRVEDGVRTRPRIHPPFH